MTLNEDAMWMIQGETQELRTTQQPVLSTSLHPSMPQEQAASGKKHAPVNIQELCSFISKQNSVEPPQLWCNHLYSLSSQWSSEPGSLIAFPMRTAHPAPGKCLAICPGHMLGTLGSHRPEKVNHLLQRNSGNKTQTENTSSVLDLL